MSIQPTTTDDITLPLADVVECPVPETATVDVRETARGLAVDRNGETFVLECSRGQCVLTGVVGRDELPSTVPQWLAGVGAALELGEVRLAE
ncbi:hypothetical protein [Natrinema pallidum]|uniref:hypothetical protein n=1 Tax=Natrinema pallidum TaxID=69527 RepID=UPI001EE8F7DC|nr:hypothetical protein [Natrinema pallidum]